MKGILVDCVHIQFQPRAGILLFVLGVDDEIIHHDLLTRFSIDNVLDGRQGNGWPIQEIVFKVVIWKIEGRIWA